MRFNRVSAIVLRHFYLIRGSFSRLIPHVCMGRRRYGVVGVHHAGILILVTASGLNFVPIFLGAVLLWDFFTRVMHGVTTAFFRRRLVPQLPQYLCNASFYLGVHWRPCAFEHCDEPYRPECDACSGNYLVWPVIRRLRHRVCSVSCRSVYVRHSAWNLCQCSGAAAWACIGVVHLAHSGPYFALRRGLLSPFDTAALDAISVAGVAALICV